MIVDIVELNKVYLNSKKAVLNFRFEKLNTFRKWYYLTVAVLSLTIFLLTLPKGDTIAKDQRLSSTDLNLIRENDHFEKFDPSQVQIPTPAPTPLSTPKPDTRLVVLQKYLLQFDSPLKEHAQDFLDAADTYQIDWRLVPSIAGVESTFGRSIPGGHDPGSTSYNGWGWGVYGDKVIKFKSWRQAIFAVTKGIKEGYIDKGLTDPFSINKKYASDPDWGGTLTYFLNDLDLFASLNKPNLSTPEEIQNQIFQNYAYLKNEESHFSLQFSGE